MVSQGLFERDQIQQQWGSSAEQIRHLEQQLARQRNDWESDAQSMETARTAPAGHRRVAR